MDVKLTLDKTIEKLRRTCASVGDKIAYRTIDGKYNDLTNEPDWWTNGFWPGILWLAYEKTGEQEFADCARGVEAKLDVAMRDFYGLHHDVGFMWKLSSVANYRLTGDTVSAKRGYMAASILASRFNIKGNFIRAWNADRVGWAIIDCMMNLPILYWCSEYMHDPRFAHIAKAHAHTTAKNFIYPDGSSKHICEFDPTTGEYIKNFGGQGYSEESAWSRGNAWALHGFALSYKYSREPEFLETAERVAKFFIEHLPDDYVPFADLKAPAEINIRKDTSAAACAASGLVLLSGLAEDKKDYYLDAAKKIIQSLYENYTDWENDEALLQKGNTAFHITDYGVETSLIYGDYFFLEALMQMNGYEGLF